MDHEMRAYIIEYLKDKVIKRLESDLTIEDVLIILDETIISETIEEAISAYEGGAR